MPRLPLKIPAMSQNRREEATRRVAEARQIADRQKDSIERLKAAQRPYTRGRATALFFAIQPKDTRRGLREDR